MLGKAETALAKPGPPVTNTTAGSPVTLAQASAMCIAAASWRVSTNSSPSSSTASTRGRMVSPTMVKIFWMPSSLRARTIR